MTAATPTVEFSRPIDLDRIGDVEVVHDIAATGEECAALAKRFGLISIERLEARLKLRRRRGKALLRLSGHVSAELAQSCVVTTEAVPGHVEHDFTVLYGDVDQGSEVLIDPQEQADFEPMPSGALDIGETVAQELAMALDPYPRAPGATVPPIEPTEGAGEDVADTPAEHPFAVLAKLKKTEQ
jgi:uncharacterized metal-binding protein YceD (DUF177 family)